MPISVPDHCLTIERNRLAEFFLLFARFEFALKAASFARMGRWGAEVDWNKFSKDVTPLLLSMNHAPLRAAINYLQDSPPKKQVLKNGVLDWEDRPAPTSYSELRALIFYMQGARNNLMHGAKFLEKEQQTLKEILNS